MKNPILEHVHLFAKGLIVTVGIFVLTIFISDFYEKHLLNIMPVCVTWILSVFTILWPFIGLTITLVKSIRFIIKNIFKVISIIRKCTGKSDEDTYKNLCSYFRIQKSL